MSRIKSIDDLQITAANAQRDLGNEIHRVFYPGRQVLYQGDLCYTENPDDWTEMEVVGPHNQTKIVIRDPRTGFASDRVVEGTSMRLALKKDTE